MNGTEFLERYKNGKIPDTRPKCSGCGEPIKEHPDEMIIVGMDASRGTIEITVMPDAEAPPEIRRQWIGVRMKPLCFVKNLVDGTGVLSNEPEASGPHYVVRFDDALKALEDTGKKEAAEWWRANVKIGEDEQLAFSAECCEEIEPVSPRVE